MKVFISQSLPRSLSLATTLEEFVRKVVPGTDPWVSDSGIDKGSRFMSEIRDNLNDALAGIVCLTPENLLEPWILYEAGALSTKVTDRVWTLLLDVEHTAVAAPLSGFNHTRVERADVLKMMRSIRKTMLDVGEKTCTEADLEKYFAAFWTSELEPKILDLRAQDSIPRSPLEPLSEIRGLLREVGDHVSRTAWRQDKTLAMLHHVYATVVGRPPGSLSDLKNEKFDGLKISEQLKATLVDMSWQPQYAGTPLPLRQSQQRQQQEITKVEPPAPPEASST